MSATTPIATQCHGYTPVPMALMTPDEVPAVDLYRRDLNTGRLQLYRAANVPITQDDLNKLAETQINWLYAAEIDPDEMQMVIRRKLDALVRDDSVGIRDRFRKLNDIVTEVLSSAFEVNNTDEIVSSSAEIGQLAVRVLCEDEMTAGDLISLMHHDFQTATHSLNVAYMMVILARKMHLVPDSELSAVAAAGILHDIGKLSVSDRILSKNDRLQRREQRVAQKHPALGFNRLCRRVDISFAQLMVIYQHHERMHGRGYPVGACDDEIHPWARLCSVVNVFDSLISNRPYRKRYPLHEAISMMDEHLSDGLDQEMYRCWKQYILKK
ncbi:HD-GYP domain-containing protein [Bremerella cremea]|uniref:HD-GYP domain-containing protein n=1 Tax=Bremerella cremea TaxID=1031537 RepID=UPI0031E69FF5